VAAALLESQHDDDPGGQAGHPPAISDAHTVQKQVQPSAAPPGQVSPGGQALRVMVQMQPVM